MSTIVIAVAVGLAGMFCAGYGFGRRANSKTIAELREVNENQRTRAKNEQAKLEKELKLKRIECIRAGWRIEELVSRVEVLNALNQSFREELERRKRAS